MWSPQLTSAANFASAASGAKSCSALLAFCHLRHCPNEARSASIAASATRRSALAAASSAAALAANRTRSASTAALLPIVMVSSNAAVLRGVRLRLSGVNGGVRNGTLSGILGVQGERKPFDRCRIISACPSGLSLGFAKQCLLHRYVLTESKTASQCLRVHHHAFSTSVIY